MLADIIQREDILFTIYTSLRDFYRLVYRIITTTNVSLPFFPLNHQLHHRPFIRLDYWSGTQQGVLSVCTLMLSLHVPHGPITDDWLITISLWDMPWQGGEGPVTFQEAHQRTEIRHVGSFSSCSTWRKTGGKNVMCQINIKCTVFLLIFSLHRDLERSFLIFHGSENEPCWRAPLRMFRSKEFWNLVSIFLDWKLNIHLELQYHGFFNHCQCKNNGWAYLLKPRCVPVTFPG